MDIALKGELGTASHRRFLTPFPSFATTIPQSPIIYIPLIAWRLVLQQLARLADMATVLNALSATCILALHHMCPTNAVINFMLYSLHDQFNIATFILIL